MRGRKVLHIAPETALRNWFLTEGADLQIEYLTLDASSDSSGLKQDICALGVPSESIDIVVCHRVLEHVLDDNAALNEIHRVLRPGGFLNVSVPQSMQMEHSNEWIIPDLTQHGHVRQYGRDFEQRLKAVGFQVATEFCLLNRSTEEHVADGTYPMRIYTCMKSEAV